MEKNSGAHPKLTPEGNDRSRIAQTHPTDALMAAYWKKYPRKSSYLFDKPDFLRRTYLIEQFGQLPDWSFLENAPAVGDVALYATGCDTNIMEGWALIRCSLAMVSWLEQQNLSVSNAFPGTYRDSVLGTAFLIQSEGGIPIPVHPELGPDIEFLN